MGYIIHKQCVDFNAKTINSGSAEAQPETRARGGMLPMGGIPPFVFKRKKRAILGVLLFKKYPTNKKPKTLLPCCRGKLAPPLKKGGGGGVLSCVSGGLSFYILIH